MKVKVYIRNTFGIPLFSPKRKKRLLLIAKEILLQQSDIVFLEEIFFEKEVLFLKKILSDYFVIKSKKHIFDLGGGLLTFIHKNINYKASYVSYTKSGFLTDLSITDKIANKGFQIIEISDNKQTLTFIHTHLTCPYEKKESKRMNNLINLQLTELTSFIQKEAGALCVCGDFNLEPDSQLLENFIKKNQLKEESELIKKTYIDNFYFLNFLFKNTTVSKKIDYIFSKNIKGNFSVKSLNDPCFISDHKALLAEIYLE